jgi:putative oxidoreductase
VLGCPILCAAFSAKGGIRNAHITVFLLLLQLTRKSALASPVEASARMGNSLIWTCLGRGPLLRRLFSTFARGWPGVGLLLLRLVSGVALIDCGVARLWSGPPGGLALLSLLMAGAGLLLLAGLWTPVAGTLVPILALWNLISHPGDPWISILLGTIGAALALLGPGAWSVDARLFGWRRLDTRIRKS